MCTNCQKQGNTHTAPWAVKGFKPGSGLLQGHVGVKRQKKGRTSKRKRQARMLVLVTQIKSAAKDKHMQKYFVKEAEIGGKISKKLKYSGKESLNQRQRTSYLKYFGKEPINFDPGAWRECPTSGRSSGRQPTIKAGGDIATACYFIVDPKRNIMPQPKYSLDRVTDL